MKTSNKKSLFGDIRVFGSNLLFEMCKLRHENIVHTNLSSFAIMSELQCIYCYQRWSIGKVVGTRLKNNNYSTYLKIRCLN